MYQLTKKLTRTNIEIPWVDAVTTLDPQYIEYFNKNYVETGKQVFRHSEDDELGLERTVIVLWESKEVWDEFEADTLMTEMRSIHSQNIKNAGITEETVSLVEI
jgi:hypothetical protein